MSWHVRSTVTTTRQRQGDLAFEKFRFHGDGDTFTTSSKAHGRLTARGEELRMLAASDSMCAA